MVNESRLEKVFLFGIVGATIFAIATFCRFLSISIGWDIFTSNMAFLIVLILGGVFYALIQLLLMDAINIFFKKKNSNKEIDLSVEKITDTIEEAEQQKNDVKIEESKEEIKLIDNEEKEFAEKVDIREKKIKEIRENKEKQESLIKEEKLKIAFEYTIEVLAPYVSENDMSILYKNINLYTEKGDFENMKPITTKEVTVKDLKHYGWNLWNHFGTKVNQENIALFLKKTFEKKIGAIKISSLTGNLTVDGDEGIITIKKSLNELEKVTID